MQIDWDRVKVYIKPGATDMRKHYTGLAYLVQSAMGKAVCDGSLYVFCNRSRTIIKVLYWDTNGFCIWSKRLERHTFPWPKDENAAREISVEYFLLLLQGINIFSQHHRIEFFYAS